MAVARQVSEYLNAFGLAFKTYKISDLDGMIKAVAGEGARISTEKTADEFEKFLLERGFLVFPAIADNQDGVIRVIRANSITANLLSAFRYPGQYGDGELARLLKALQNRRRDDMSQPESGAE